MVILHAMWAKFKLWQRVLMGGALAAVIVIFFLRHQDFQLNRTIRNIALRLVQIEVLSRTTAVDYKVLFESEGYSIEIFDREAGTWKPYLAAKYPRSIRSKASEFEFVFSRGFFREYLRREGEGRGPKYIIIDIYLPETTKKRSLIFYRDGDWRVLG